jgi:hypothetical protein
MNEHNQETVKTALDGLSIVTVVGTLVDMLPSFAALFTIIWTGIRIWETATVQKLLGIAVSKEQDDADQK